MTGNLLIGEIAGFGLSTWVIRVRRTIGDRLEDLEQKTATAS